MPHRRAQIMRHGIGKGFQFSVGGQQLLVAEVQGAIGLIEGLGLAVEFGKHRDFGFQDRRVDGLGQVIDRPGTVA